MALTQGFLTRELGCGTLQRKRAEGMTCSHGGRGCHTSISTERGNWEVLSQKLSAYWGKAMPGYQDITKAP